MMTDVLFCVKQLFKASLITITIYNIDFELTKIKQFSNHNPYSSLYSYYTFYP